MTETNMTELLKFADAASSKSGNWWTALMAAILCVFAYAVIRYLVKELGTARADYHATLRKIIDDQNNLTAKLMVSLDRNTEALRINNLLLEKQNRQ